MKQSRLVLASGSPRRRELLTDAGYEFEIVVPRCDAECGVCSGEGPAELVSQLAVRKAADVRVQLAERRSSANLVVVAADTVAECDGQILGKPRDETHARQMLQQMSGRLHRVWTGVCVGPIRMETDPPAPLVRVAQTTLRMDRLTDAQLDEYLDSGQWEGKAGAFGYQDRLGWVHIVEGSESNVVGLPMELLGEMLREVGYSASR
jgi:septum formation protein